MSNDDQQPKKPKASSASKATKQPESAAPGAADGTPNPDTRPDTKPDSKPDSKPDGKPNAEPQADRDARLPGILRSAPSPKKPQTPADPANTAEGETNDQPGSKTAENTPEKGDAKPTDGPYRRETKLPVNPRRVRGGVRMKRKDGDPEAWSEQRLWRLVEKAADGETLKEGLEYARGGQTRRIGFENGEAEGSVQGRRARPYQVSVTLPKYTPDQKADVVRALGDQARYAAKLLAGDLPPSIEDVFVPLGLHLFPKSEADFKLSCTCKEENHPWCKHVVCVAALLGEKLAADPFLIFELRGMPRDHLVEGLRDFRALTTMGPGPQPLYAAHVPGLSDATPPPLEESIHKFWRTPKKGTLPSVPVEPPEVSHPLLRRLGPSPFPESKFPLVGLLATCYDLIGRDALAAEFDAGAETESDPDHDDGPRDEPQGEAGKLPEAPLDPTSQPESTPDAPSDPPERPRASARPLKRS